MGKIKKLKDVELVGGTEQSDVYPITSTKAIYDENNKRLDSIISELQKSADSSLETENKTIVGSINELKRLQDTGYLFKDVATPTTDPGTPKAKVFYIANGKGTYEKFGGINVTEDEVVVLYYDTAWHKVSTGIASQAKLSELGQYVDNPEWSMIVTDANDRILYGVKIDGKFYFGDDCPPQVQEYVAAQLGSFNIEDYNDIKTFLGDLIDGDTLTTLLNTKVDKVTGKSLIDSEFATSQEVVTSPEYLQVTTDSEDKILEGIKTDGTKVIELPLEIQGVRQETINNPEFIQVTTDSEGKILEGITSEGKKKLAFPTDQDDKLNVEINSVIIDIDKLCPLSSGFHDLESSLSYLVEHPEYVQYGSILKYRNSYIEGPKNLYLSSLYIYHGTSLSLNDIKDVRNWSLANIGGNNYAYVGNTSICISKIDENLAFAANHFIDKYGYCYVAYLSSTEWKSFVHNYQGGYDVVAKFNILKPWDVTYNYVCKESSAGIVARSDVMIAEIDDNNFIVLTYHVPTLYTVMSKSDLSMVEQGYCTLNGMDLTYENIFAIGHQINSDIPSVPEYPDGQVVCHVNIVKHSDGYYYTTWSGYATNTEGTSAIILAKSADCKSWTAISALYGEVGSEVATAIVGNYAYIIGRGVKNVFRTSLLGGQIETICYFPDIFDERPYAFVINNSVFFAVQYRLGYYIEDEVNNTRKAYIIYCLSKDYKMIPALILSNWDSALDTASFEYKNGRLTAVYSGNNRFNDDYENYPGIPESKEMFKRKGDNDVYYTMVDSLYLYELSLGNSLV